MEIRESIASYRARERSLTWSGNSTRVPLIPCSMTRKQPSTSSLKQATLALEMPDRNGSFVPWQSKNSNGSGSLSRLVSGEATWESPERRKKPNPPLLGSILVEPREPPKLTSPYLGVYPLGGRYLVGNIFLISARSNGASSWPMIDGSEIALSASSCPLSRSTAHIIKPESPSLFA